MILKDLKWHPYKVHIVQALSDEDCASLLHFADEELRRMAENPQHLVCLRSPMRRTSTWTAQLIATITDTGLRRTQSGLSSKSFAQKGRQFGTLLFDETINGVRYLAMLQDQF